MVPSKSFGELNSNLYKGSFKEFQELNSQCQTVIDEAIFILKEHTVSSRIWPRLLHFDAIHEKIILCLDYPWLLQDIPSESEKIQTFWSLQVLVINQILLNSKHVNKGQVDQIR